MTSTQAGRQWPSEFTLTKDSVSGWTVAAVAISGAAALSALAVLYFIDPATSRLYPKCIFHNVTGLHCPFCGSLRALHASMHGQFLPAFRDNALLVIGLPASAVWLGLVFLSQRRIIPIRRIGLPSFWLCMGVVLVFGVIRNVPFLRFLTPDNY